MSNTNWTKLNEVVSISDNGGIKITGEQGDIYLAGREFSRLMGVDMTLLAEGIATYHEINSKRKLEREQAKITAQYEQAKAKLEAELKAKQEELERLTQRTGKGLSVA